MSRTNVLILSSLAAIVGMTGILFGWRACGDNSADIETTCAISAPPLAGEPRDPAELPADGEIVRRVGYASEESADAPIRFADETHAIAERGRTARRLFSPRRPGNLLRRSPLEPLDSEQLERSPTRNPSRSVAVPSTDHRTAEAASAVPEETDWREDDWFRPAKEVTAAMAARRERIQQVQRFYYYQRPLNTRDDSPWSMMHHMLAWGVDGYIQVGAPGGRQASVIAWLCGNGPCEGERLLEIGPSGLRARMAAGLQGHEGQLLAMFAQARVAVDQQLRVNNQLFTIADLIESEQATCRSPSELTFKLMGLVHYVPTESSWRNQRGETWDFPRLMDEEIRAPINGVTCGGTHRLMALAYAVRRRRREGHSIDGVWDQARRHVASYQQRALQLQNRDGSLSSDFFRKRGTWGDAERKLRTTGHVLEWLIFSLPHDQLQDGRVTAAVDYLCNLLINNRYYDWGKGHLGHSLRALVAV